jgi:molecular chaperone GrpE
MSDVENTTESPETAPATPAEAHEPSKEETPVVEAPDPVQTAKAEAAKYKDQLLRALADNDNFRKRARKEVEDANRNGKSDLLKDFLPVFDNVERALKSGENATEVKPVIEGLQMVLRQFTDMLGKHSIVRTPGVGTPFDPSFHEAIQQIETDESPAGTILAEVQPGWVQGERLLRAALVVVAKPKG